MPPSRILIIGGYGAFGYMAAQRLAQEDSIEIVIAGRNVNQAQKTSEILRAGPLTRARITEAVIDAKSCTPENLTNLNASVVINASGPFQHQNYHLANTCIAARVHYIDLADSREFVCGITMLDNAAKKSGVTVISGASSLPGLSSAVVAHFRSKFRPLTSVEMGLSPGNRFEHGIATTRSVMSYVGKPITMTVDGQRQNVIGWQGLQRYNFPIIGPRWLGYADVPDLDLLPRTHTNLKSVTFKAGVELSFIHLGLWALSGLVRLGLIDSLEPSANLLRNLNRKFSSFGSEKGGMFVSLSGRDNKNQKTNIVWTLIADSGHGPYIPVIAPVVLAKRMTKGQTIKPGARPCFEEFSLQEFKDGVADLDISFCEITNKTANE